MIKQLFTITALMLSLFCGPLYAEQEESPHEVPGATTVDTTTAKEMFLDGVSFIDVRSDSDWEAGRIPEAIHIELKKKFTEDVLNTEIEKNQDAVFYCNGAKCLRSSKASAKAVSWGYSKVYYYRDGFPSWKAAGHPIE